MVAFLLGLLKGIGIFLLIVLGLILVVVAVVLFVPIRYRGEGQITDDMKEGMAQATWMGKMVRVGINYRFPQKPIVSVKVLWIDVLKLLERKKKVPKTKNNVSQENHPAQVSLSQDSPEHAPKHEEIVAEEVSITDSEIPKKNKKLSLRQKIENIIFKITSVYDKIKRIKNNIQYYIEILQEDESKQLLADAWGGIVKILKSIRPSVFEVKGEFGFDCPDTTGRAYGAYCTVMPFLGEHVVLTPNFEERIIQGELKFKGKITVFVIVRNALRILFDSRLKPLVNKLKDGGNENGRE